LVGGVLVDGLALPDIAGQPQQLASGQGNLVVDVHADVSEALAIGLASHKTSREGFPGRLRIQVVELDEENNFSPAV